MRDRGVPAFGEIAASEKKLFVRQKSAPMRLHGNLSHLEIAAKEAADWSRRWLIQPR